MRRFWNGKRVELKTVWKLILALFFSMLSPAGASGGMSGLFILPLAFFLSINSVRTIESARIPQVVSGTVQPETVAAELGALNRTYSGYTVSGQGSEMTLTAQVGSSGKPYLLEVQEIHDRRPAVFGYTVLVNGTEVYFRTYEEIAAGPNHYFIQVPTDVAPGGSLQITFHNESDAPFCIGRVWVYSDFFGLAESEGTYRSMPLLVKGDSTTINKVMGSTNDPSAWQNLKQSYNTAEGIYLPGGGWSQLPYTLRTEAQIVADLNAVLNLAVTEQVVPQVLLHGDEWGGASQLPDGLGGYFSDVRYAQGIYDKDLEQYIPVWHDTPGSTTWPTRNDTAFRENLSFRQQRTFRLLADRLAFLKAEGVEFPTPTFCGDIGPSYRTGGDFSASAVAAAASDGVALNPEDGLDSTEKMWMHRNLSQFCKASGEAMAKGLGRDPIWVDSGTVSYPEQQLSDNLFSHPFFSSPYPLFDDRWAGWQNGVNDWQWSSGETVEARPPSFYDYVTAIGKMACVNLERGALNDYSYLEKLYQRGFQSVALYNPRTNDIDLILADSVGMESRASLPAPHHLRKLLDLNFSRDGALGPVGFVQSNNMTLPPDFEKTMQVNNLSQPGSVIYLIQDDGRPLPGSMMVRMKGVISATAGNKIEVLAGSSLNSLQLIRTLTSADMIPTVYWPYDRSVEVDLGSLLQGQTSGYVEIRITVVGTTVGHTSLTSLDVALPWSQLSGHPGGEPFTVKQKRTLQLWIQDRAVYERLFERFISLGGDPAIALSAASDADLGRYRAAYKKLAGAISQILPARFALRGFGELEPYPVEIHLADTQHVAVVDLIQADSQTVEMAFTVKETQTALVSLYGLTSGGKFRMEYAGPNHYRIETSVDGEMIATNGTLELSMELHPEIVAGETGFLAASTGRAPLRQLTAMAVGNWMFEVQDAGLYMHNPLYIPKASNAVVTRWKDGSGVPDSGLNYPQLGDCVELMLNEAGEATNVVAVYGEDQGRIKSFQPPAISPEPCNGIVELENGKRYELMYRYGFTKVTVPLLEPVLRKNSFDDLVREFFPGRIVTVTYSPFTWEGSLPRLVTLQAGPASAVLDESLPMKLAN